TDVTVANVDPTVAAASDQNSDEGASASFDLGSFTDAGTNDAPWHVSVTWGDASSDTFNGSAQGALGSLSHAYNDNGTYAVTVTATDKDGGTGTESTHVTVSNVAPTAHVTGAPATSPEGTSIPLGSTVFDPSSVDTAAGFTYAWSVTKNAN